MCDANNDVCALYKAKPGTNSAASSTGYGDSLSNKKAVVIGHLTAHAHLPCNACGPKFSEEFGGASASVSVPSRPGARRGPAGGLPRAPDGTGRLSVVRPGRPRAGRRALQGETC